MRPLSSAVKSQNSNTKRERWFRTSDKKNLDNYLCGPLKSPSQLGESKRFQEQAQKSGFNQMDTQKLLDLVQKYGDSAITMRTGEVGTRDLSPINKDFKNFTQNSQPSDYHYGQSPNNFEMGTPISHRQQFSDALSSRSQQFQDKVQKNQEDRRKRLQDLKDKLNKKSDLINLQQTDSLPQLAEQSPSIQLEEYTPQREKEQVLSTVSKLCESQEEYEAIQKELDAQYYYVPQQAAPDVLSKGLKGGTQTPQDPYNVHNRLYSYARTKNQSQLSNCSNSNIFIQNPKPSSQGHKQHAEAQERDKRLKAMQEGWKYKIEEERKRSKVNIKSHQMAYKKLERDFENAVLYVDYDESGLLDLTQVGQLLFVLGVYKYLFNEQYENQQQQKQSKFRVEPLTQQLINIEERKQREEEFLMQLWIKVNPRGNERVESQIILEFLKLLYDPYTSGNNTKNQERLLDEYVQAIKRIQGGEDEDGGSLMDQPTKKQAYQHDLSSELHSSRTASEKDDVIWTTLDLLNTLKVLTDNYSSFKIAGASGVKAPTVRQRQGFFEAHKECTFKPSINKRSKLLEKQHWANFFGQQHSKNQSNQSKLESESRLEYAGRIVNQSELKYSSFAGRQSQLSEPLVYEYQEQDNLLDRQIKELQSNPSSVKVDHNNRVELLLQKEKLREEKLRQQQLQKQLKEDKACTFKPDINKSSGQWRPSSSVQLCDTSNVEKAAHQRLWELSKAKKLNLPQRKPFDDEYQVMQECTFKPNTSKSAGKFQKGQRSRDTSRMDSDTSQTFIKGYEQTVERMKKANQMKDIKKQQIESLGKSKNYSGVPTVVKPFQLKSKSVEQQQKRAHQEPIIEIEITIATGKTAHICVREGDDVRQLAKNFCKTYSLNEATRKRLEEQLVSYIIERGNQPSKESHSDSQMQEHGQEFSQANNEAIPILYSGESELVNVENNQNDLEYYEGEDYQNNQWDFQTRSMDEEREENYSQ